MTNILNANQAKTNKGKYKVKLKGRKKIFLKLSILDKLVNVCWSLELKKNSLTNDIYMDGLAFKKKKSFQIIDTVH